MLLEVTDPDTGEGLTDKQVRDETISFFIAGHATIASAPTWTWYLLSTHPEAWRRLRPRSATSSATGRRPADLPHLTWTIMVVQEAMRLYPPIYLVLRCWWWPTRSAATASRPGINIALCPYVTHRHPGFWTTSRLRTGAVRTRGGPRPAPHGLLPFSGGPRRRISEGFAHPAPRSWPWRPSATAQPPPGPPGRGRGGRHPPPRAPMLMRVDRVA